MISELLPSNVSLCKLPDYWSVTAPASKFWKAKRVKEKELLGGKYVKDTSCKVYFCHFYAEIIKFCVTFSLWFKF